MKIRDYSFEMDNWRIDNVRFQDLNLIVGDSGSGKTRLLNTIFNFGSYVANRKLKGVSSWDITLDVDGTIYHWQISSTKIDNSIVVENEILRLDGELLVSRDLDNFLFCGDPLPKLQKDNLSVTILQEEDLIKPLYDGFTNILRRRFFEDDLRKNSSIYAVSRHMLETIGEKQDLKELFRVETGLNPKLFILERFFTDIYNEIVSFFMNTFEFISEVSIRDSGSFELDNIPGRAPIFCIKEHNVDEWIRLDELSSGMQKVLLVITDLLTMPRGGIYILDEYENSLGTSAINFLPELLLHKEIDNQIILTSHHPYIIGKFPVSNWYITSRKGPNVSFTFGEILSERYNVSSQEKYLQLLNDPKYSEGIE